MRVESELGISPPVFPGLSMRITEIWPVGTFNTSIAGLILTPWLAHYPTYGLPGNALIGH